MKIVSINAKHSTPGEIAILTQPPVSAAMYDKLRAACQSSPLLHTNPIKLEGPLFIIRISQVTPEIAQAIQKLLDDAEQAVHRDEEAAQQKAEAQKAEERQRIETAAKIFGVPVQ
jgi:hypothetical protein